VNSEFINPLAIVSQFGLRPGMKVADFGAGAGYFTVLMAQQVGESGVVTAVDVMEPALESVRLKAVAAGVRNLQTKRANLEVLGSTGLGDFSQDFVLLANILFQSQKQAEIIKEARRVLKVGSDLVIIDWKKAADAPQSGAGGFGPPITERLDPNTIKALVEGSGFNSVRAFAAGGFHFWLVFQKS